MENYVYDVALSFAGEDREYVSRVAEFLQSINVKVFYDKFEEGDLWGKDLFIYLNNVYQRMSKYCVVFISKYYKEKLWTNHEMKAAFARAFQQKSEYLLPVRFDDTELQGINLTIGYLDLKNIEPDELGRIIARKLNPNIDIDLMLMYIRNWLPNTYNIYIKGVNVCFENISEEFYNEYPIQSLLAMFKNNQLENMFLYPGIIPY